MNALERIPATEAALTPLGTEMVAELGVEAQVAFGELTLIAERDAIVNVLTVLRDRFGFQQLLDVCGVDFPDREERCEVVYHLLSMYRNHRIRVKTAVGEDEMIASVMETHPSANWFERETFDMFGIVFSGHPDLRRILTDYGFRGYPLRKDFPTTGYTEVRYDEALKRVVYEPVKLVQEYRQFDFMSPWEGAEYILPGDQKAAK